MRSTFQLASSSLVVLATAGSAAAQAQTPLPGSAIRQFDDPLPVLSVAGGPIQTVIAGAEELELHMREFRAAVMPSTFVPAKGGYSGTWVWGYTLGPDAPAGTLGTYTGPVIVATRDVPTQIRFVNDLGYASTTNVLAWKYSTDQTLHWADPLGGGANACAHHAQMFPGMPPMGQCAENYDGPIPAVVHLHGGDVPPLLDGGPDAWFTSDGAWRGPAYYTRPGVSVAGNEAVYRYPNSQEAAPTWFHDHALGITRLNVYAGLAGAYDIIDPQLQLPTGLHPLGLEQSSGELEYLVPLVIQDRMFDVDGQLYFPHVGINPDHPFWLPEFVGDTIVVNGKVWPHLEVEAKRYRFLLINGSNARTYELFLADFGSGTVGPSIWQIGTDGGYLDAPAKIDAALGQKLVLMPGERADVIVDFAGLQGQTLLLRNIGRTPYPKGAAPNGTTVGRILQIRVQGSTVVDTSYDPASGVAIRSGDQKIVRLVDPAAGALAAGVAVAKVRQLTLNEVMAMPMPPYPGGPLEVLVNNTLWDGTDRPDFTAISVGGHTTYYSELPEEGTTEVWEIVNLTADAHPIHTHLTQVQIINRQAFRTKSYTSVYEAAFPGGAYIGGHGPPLDYNTGNPRALGGNPDIMSYLQGKALPPSPNEAGWKDTVLMLPGQVTRIAVRYAPQDKAVNAPDAHYAFDPNALGQGYVWHCHIIDHEDNEMMRPLAVLPKPGVTRTYEQGTDY